MRVVRVATFLLALSAQAGGAAQNDERTLKLPRALNAGEPAWIEVDVGPLSRGQEISVATVSGRELGVISPHGIRQGQDAGHYSLPIPDDAFQQGQLSIRLTITQAGNAPRAPTALEVRAVRLGVDKQTP